MREASDEMVQQLLSTPSFRGVAEFLSNFAPYHKGEFHFYRGIYYPSNEHFYQAQKFDFDPDIQMRVALHPSKGLKRFIRGLPSFDADRWKNQKLWVMEEGLRHKFLTLSRFGKLLASTGFEYIEERNTWKDTYWGTYLGEGENHLGKLIMKIRDEL